MLVICSYKYKKTRIFPRQKKNNNYYTLRHNEKIKS